MENKVVDNREEQMIECEAEAYCRNEDFSERMYDSNKNSYIAGATKQLERNKEDAIGFLNYLIDEQMVFDWSTQTFEQLYEIYINQKV